MRASARSRCVAHDALHVGTPRGQRNMIARLQRPRGQVEAAERERLLDDERQRIARELHDRVAQTLFSIGLAAQSALEHDGDAENGDGHQQGAALESIRGLSAVGDEQMREAIFALSRARPRPPGGGLAPVAHGGTVGIDEGRCPGHGFREVQ